MEAEGKQHWARSKNPSSISSLLSLFSLPPLSLSFSFRLLAKARGSSTRDLEDKNRTNLHDALVRGRGHVVGDVVFSFLFFFF